jgi:hypothetical protein
MRILLKALIMIGILIIPLQEVLSQNMKAKLVETNETELIVSVDIPSYQGFDIIEINNNLKQSVFNGDKYLIDSLGKPNIPVIITKIAIPNGMKPIVKITKGKPFIYDNIDLPPVQDPQMDSESERKYRYDSVIYKTNKFYPGKIAECGNIKNKRGYKFSELYMYPYQYNPVINRLTVYPELSVTVKFKGIHHSIRKPLKNQMVEDFIRHQTINGHKILETESFDAEKTVDQKVDVSLSNLKSATLSSSGGCEFLIITHDDFEGAANSLLNWKESIGIQTTVVKTSDISSTYDADNDATRRVYIEAYIDTAYNNWTPCPEYLLLLGDEEFIPTFERYQLPSTAYTTDIHYADTDSPNDYEADIPGYGRLPVDTEGEATTVVNKIISYESTYKGISFYSNVLGAAYFQDREDYEYTCDGKAALSFAEVMEDIGNFMENGLGLNFNRVYTAQTGCGINTPTEWKYDCCNPDNPIRIPLEWWTSVEPEDLDWSGETSDIINAIENGCFLAMHRGHGLNNGWSDPQFETDDVLALNNGNLTPIVWSINCLTGDFLSGSYHCLAEELLLHPSGGGVGVVAATEETGTFSNEKLIKGMVDAIWSNYNYGSSDNVLYRLGDILDHGKSFTDDMSKSLYHCLGDPTMRIYPYNCQAGEVYLSNETLYNTLVVDICKSGYVNNYEIKNGASLTINFGELLEITNDFEIEIGATLTIEPDDIETGFQY